MGHVLGLVQLFINPLAAPQWDAQVGASQGCEFQRSRPKASPRWSSADSDDTTRPRGPFVTLQDSSHADLNLRAKTSTCLEEHAIRGVCIAMRYYPSVVTPSPRWSGSGAGPQGSTEAQRHSPTDQHRKCLHPSLQILFRFPSAREARVSGWWARRSQGCARSSLRAGAMRAVREAL